MRDTHRRYRAIAQCLLQRYPHVRGHQQRHLSTLARLITGMAGSQHAQPPKAAEQTPSGRAADESVVMRLRRWLKHDDATYTRGMLPVARALTVMPARRLLVVVIDGRTMGRGCMRLMIRVLYQRRALPITWVAAAGRKGHLPEALHCALLEQRARLVPADAAVTIVGDEYDGTDWHAAITARGWQYVCRTACDILLSVADTAIAMRDRAPNRGEMVAVEPARMTAAPYGPVHARAVWDAVDAQPISLVTTHADRDHAVARYRRCAQIET